MQFTMSVPFAAPIHAGTEFMWIRFQEKTASFLGKLEVEALFDLAGGPVYGTTELSAAVGVALEKRVASPNVLQMFVAMGYVVLEQRRARCERAFVISSGQGTRRAASTILLCEALPLGGR